VYRAQWKCCGAAAFGRGRRHAPSDIGAFTHRLDPGENSQLV
jgi:hypothetical protein